MNRYATGSLIGLMMLFLGAAGVHAQDDGASPPPADTGTKHRHFPIGIDRVPEEYREKMPLPFGINVDFFGSKESYLFRTAAVSFNGMPIPPEAMELDSIATTQDSWSVRADAWILPYLNVYLLGAKFSGNTRNIKAMLLDPNMPMPPLPQRIPFSGSNFGVGAAAAGGYKSVFFSYDWNISWARLDLASGRIPTITHGPRLGAVFDKPRVQAAIYVGGFREQVSGDAQGSISFEGIGTFDYKVTVAPETAWNFIAGFDLELNKRWVINCEHGFGDRTQDLISIGARF